MKKIKLSIILISFAMFLFSCGGGTDANNNEGETTNNNEENNEVVEGDVTNNVETTNVENNEVVNEPTQESCGFPIETVEDFLYYVAPDGLPATFESSNGLYIFFRADGTMAGGGPTGEESMWEANWEFQPSSPTGMIVLNITMEATNTAYQFGNGGYNVEYFPDDNALVINCVDFIKQAY